MFRATMCPPSGEITVFMQHLVLVILCGWLSGMQVGNCIPVIIRRNNCVYATLGTCYSVWMTVWYAGWKLHTSHHQEKQLCLCDTWYLLLCGWLSGMQVPTCIPDSHPHRITSTKCRISTVVSPDDGYIVAWSI